MPNDHPRMERESKTLEAMIRLYCRRPKCLLSFLRLSRGTGWCNLRIEWFLAMSSSSTVGAVKTAQLDGGAAGKRRRRRATEVRTPVPPAKHRPEG